MINETMVSKFLRQIQDSINIVTCTNKNDGENVKYNVNEIALSRTDAMDKCIVLGIKFIQHFHKLYKEPSTQAKNHWLSEMGQWYNSVKQIRLKQNNSNLLRGELRDWFFTAGSNFVDITKDADRQEEIAYDDFIYYLLNDMTINDAWNKVSNSIRDSEDTYLEDKVSPMIYHKLYEIGFTEEDLIGKSDDEIYQLYYSNESKISELKTKTTTPESNKSENSSPKTTKQQYSEENNKNVYKESNTLNKIKYNIPTPKQFKQTFEKTKLDFAKVKQGAWRVSSDYTEEDYSQMKLFATDNGSTVAVHDGDIVSVCINPKDSGIVYGSDLLQQAINNGGNKLDAYDYLFKFYVNNGFEPVVWIQFNPEFTPEGFNAEQEPEDIIFYKYVGKGNVKNTDMNKFKTVDTKVVDSETEYAYDIAYKLRDKSMEE